MKDERTLDEKIVIGLIIISLFLILLTGVLELLKSGLTPSAYQALSFIFLMVFSWFMLAIRAPDNPKEDDKFMERKIK